MTSPSHGRRKAVRRADKSSLLREDVTAMIRESREVGSRGVDLGDDELASDIITVVRERTLREIETYAREHIR